MRIDASRLKYLAFVIGLGACFFDPKATGPGNRENPQVTDGAVPGEGGAGTGGVSGVGGRPGAAGDGGVSTGAVSGGGVAGMSGTGASGSGGVAGMSMPMAGGPPPPPPLQNGEACTEDARCMSGHCDGICCDKGSECCKTVDDCNTQPGGLGMSCDDRTNCEGTAGKITCTNEFKCVTINGSPDDRACTNRVEANDCGMYLSVFCLGGESQNGAPPCATSCASDADCDAEAHCNEAGECVADLPNGEACTRNEDCTAGYCRNGVCCGLLGDCCKTPDDCPDMYRRGAECTDLQNCRGSQTMAVCSFNTCSSQIVPANQACNGMTGQTCGFFQDVVCMAGRNNSCRTSCTNMGDCDPDVAFCDAGRCVAKRENGESCTMANQCESNACNNNVCCAPGAECCTTSEQCTMGLDARCDRVPMQCQGSIRPGSCENSRCTYATERVEDDRACTTGRNECGGFRDITCNGERDQRPCELVCTNAAQQCDGPEFECMPVDGTPVCVEPEPNPPAGGQGGSGGNGNGNGEGNGN